MNKYIQHFLIQVDHFDLVILKVTPQAEKVWALLT